MNQNTEKTQPSPSQQTTNTVLKINNSKVVSKVQVKEQKNG